MGDIRSTETCYVCGHEADRTCDRCGEYICDCCQAPYDQFSQIDYDCCKACAETRDE